MALYHLVDNLQNTKGDALAGYYVKLRDSATDTYAALYADENLTAIEVVSGLANAAKTDANGQYDCFVEDGTYDIEFYDPNDTNQLVKSITSVPLYGRDSSTDAAAAAASAAAAAQSVTDAETAKTGAETAKTGAETAKTGAETARDAAIAGLNAEKHFTDTTLAAAITAGLAAVADTEYFRATGDDVDYIGVYLDNAGTAVEKGRYATPEALQTAIDNIAFATSYANEFGTGDRQAKITVSSTATGTLWSGTPSWTLSVNGSRTNNLSGDTRIGAVLGVDVTGLEIARWDFGVTRRPVISEITLWWNNFDINLGNAKVQASADGVTWTDLSGPQALNLPNLHPTNSMVVTVTATRGWRYFRLLGTSGTTSGTVRYLQEFEFKTALPPYDKSLEAAVAEVPGQRIVAATATLGDIAFEAPAVQSEVVYGPAAIDVLAEQAIGLKDSDYYLDSRKGLDANDGLDPITAWKTIEKLKTVVEPPADGVRIGIRAGSVFAAYNPTSQTKHNALTYDAHKVGRIAGGRSGDAPVISFGQSYTTADAQVVASDHVDATANVLKIDLSRRTSADAYTNAPIWMASESASGVPRAFYTTVASVALVASTPGSVYFTSAEGATTTAHFHPFASTSAGKTFVFPYSHGVNLRLNENAVIEDFVLTDSIDGNGAAVTGNDSVIRRVAVGFMGKHHFLWESGLVEDCFAFEKQNEVQGFQFVMYQSGQDLGEGIMIGCRTAQSSRLIENAASAIYSHSSGLQTALHVNDYISKWGGSFSPNTPIASMENAFFDHKSVKAMEFKPGRKHTVKRSLFRYETNTFGTWLTTALAGNESKEGDNYITARHCGVIGGAAGSSTSSSACHHDWQHNVTCADTDGNAQNNARMTSASIHRYNIHVVAGPRAGGVQVYVHPVANSDYNIYAYAVENTQSFSFRDLVANVGWTSITHGTPKAAFAAYQAANPTKDQNSICLNPAELDRLFLNGLAGLLAGDFRLNPYSGITFADGTPVHLIAGIREWYDFNTREVKRGAPSRLPVGPATWAEMQVARANPRAWDHYPQATPAEIIAEYA